nr:hypothetical protein [Tanacetum cinerariifolium]
MVKCEIAIRGSWFLGEDVVVDWKEANMNNFVIHHPSHPFGAPNRTISISASASAAAAESSDSPKELRVCTNRSCRRQGSMDVLQVLSGIAPPDISVISCGCLSRCGSGPNLVILPSATFVSHCGTAARAAEVMSSVCGRGSTSTSLEALSLRKKAELAIDDSDFATADILLSQAIDLNPVGGIHYLYKYRQRLQCFRRNSLLQIVDS